MVNEDKKNPVAEKRNGDHTEDMAVDEKPKEKNDNKEQEEELVNSY